MSRELIVEITTKRFEYTYESMWKSIQIFLREQGVECASPLRCFKEAFKNGLIDEKYEEIFARMVKIRNDLVHIYDEERAQELYREIVSPGICEAISSVLEKLKEILAT